MVETLIHDLDTHEIVFSFPRDDEPTLIHEWLPDDVELEPDPGPEGFDPWVLLYDPAIPIAAVTAILAFGLSVGSGTIGFLLGYLVG